MKFPNENPKFVGFVVYKQGDNGTLFYIIFTGSVKSSVWTQGVQDDVVTIIQAGKWFGDRVLETDNLLRESTTSACERTELITLSKEAYEKLLDIQKTLDLQERVNFLKVVHLTSYCTEYSNILRGAKTKLEMFGKCAFPSHL
ncbi:hypothetical protein BDL97_02G057800 [Sphagnum fallax]|nr:hypothetical protein BDL97_02G057800 [Sphagnum fallax]